MGIERPADGWDIRRVTTHPGELLREEFLEPLGLSVEDLAMRLQVPLPELQEFVSEHAGITPELALRIGRCFSSSAEFWMNMQQMHDLTKAKMEVGQRVEREVEPLKMGQAA